MPLDRVLRLALVFQWLLALASVVLFRVEQSRLPDVLREYGATQGGSTSLSAELVGWYALFWLAGSLVATAGAFLLKPWSRPLFLVMAVLGIALTGLLEPSITSPGSAAAETAAQILVGVILGLVYFSPLKEHFAPARS